MNLYNWLELKCNFFGWSVENYKRTVVGLKIFCCWRAGQLFINYFFKQLFVLPAHIIRFNLRFGKSCITYPKYKGATQGTINKETKVWYKKCILNLLHLYL